MTFVTITSKFQVLIPEGIRSAMKLSPGQRMQVQLVDGKVELIPEKTVAGLRGRWPDAGAQIEREADRC